ncbi:uncharacterized protein LOC117569695 isoform X1 [Drosophila albomicans]|uniref:Uncharacterized protein LOC117569695 isoform X1 n=1 Tax=Drosophila albomicans TaxID=7291 RepID=A0A6P8WZ94_DROAB|nr:uncharacterized protein LOC117569695 isoform X1 [Drosophila albomicans]
MENYAYYDQDQQWQEGNSQSQSLSWGWASSVLSQAVAKAGNTNPPHHCHCHWLSPSPSVNGRDGEQQFPASDRARIILTLAIKRRTEKAAKTRIRPNCTHIIVINIIVR